MVIELSEGFIHEVRRRVIEWFREKGDRELPWRRTRDAWAIVLAAMLLRVTRRDVVARVYNKLLERYPDPKAMASASVEEVREAIRPLGLYNVRAKQLVELARALVERFNGRVPCDREMLLELPGIGDYAASVILLRACNQPTPLLDSNTVRVYERLLGYKTRAQNPYRDELLVKLAEALTPRDPEEAYEFNLGVMDLGFKVCTTRSRCFECPLRDLCYYYATSVGRGVA